ncbi:hypothetical protein GHO42_25090, partial [Pseudomonas sp. FSL R10-0056]|uniref:hypothetical protein n=1 Tax=unclassified Pseudomonas TaxID=196821 RepID=UPI0012978561
MRNNQPVTQREIALGAQQKLISTTDARGVITYCNDAFVEISGFNKSDLRMLRSTCRAAAASCNFPGTYSVIGRK